MNRSTSFSLVAIAAALIAGPALADTSAKTRDQVQAELAQAVRTGNIVAVGEDSMTLNEQFPGLYPQQTAKAGKTGEQAQAELAEAVRNGDIVVGTSSKLNQMFPDLYPKQAAKAGKTREQVKTELAEAVRTGDIVAVGEDSMTLNQQFPGFYAQKAVHTNTASSGNGAVSAN
jgi:ribosomal protein L30E